MRKTIFAAAALSLLLGLGVAQAAVFTVTNTNDSGPGSLREAMSVAISRPATSPHTILFSVDGTIILETTLPRITGVVLTINAGPRNITISGNSAVRAMDLVEAHLTLIGVTIAKGYSTTGPGGIYVHTSGSGLRIINSTFASNVYDGPVDHPVGSDSYAHGGGAISSTGRLQVTGSTFHANSSNGNGGAIWYNGFATGSEISNSTFSNNSVRSTTCSDCGGGAVFVSRARLRITNSTFKGNTAVFAGKGGALYDWMAASGFRSANIVLANTIVANSSSENCSTTLPRAAIIDRGGNLSSDASCRFTEPTSVNSTDPLLGPLQDNGGRTLTMGLLTGSPAINQGVNAVAVDAAGLPLATDQRGLPRISPSGGTVDRGAFEVAGRTISFAGFFVPVDNLPTINTVLAGSLIPVRFSLNGYQGQAIFAAGYPRVDLAACGNGAVDPIEETVKVGAGSLTYDTATDRYEYVLTTDPAWKSSCRKLSLKFFDGSLQEALFGF